MFYAMIALVVIGGLLKAAVSAGMGTLHRA